MHPRPRPLMVVLCRQALDFSPLEKALLEHARPHIVAAWPRAWGKQREERRWREITGRMNGARPVWPTTGRLDDAAGAKVLRRLGLSPREADALYWVAQGKTNAEAGIILGVAPATAKHYVERLLAKLACENRTAAARTAMEILSRWAQDICIHSVPPHLPTVQTMNVGVIGVGHIGRLHARVYSELAAASDGAIRLAAVYDADAASAQAVATQFGTKAVASLDEFTALVDAATVATPTPTHFPLARQLLDAGRHLLVEKPITENLADARALSELAQAKKCVLQVGHIERFNPAFGALESLLTRPKFIEAHRLSPYPMRSTEIGVVLDLMIHDLEIILHLVRSPLANIDAVGVPVLSRGEDIANARLRFADGCVANVTASRISPEKMRKIRVFQEDAYLSLDYQNQTGEIYRRGPTGIAREAVEIERDEPMKRELQSFLECARGGLQPKVGGAQAAAALEVAMEITRLIAAN